LFTAAITGAALLAEVVTGQVLGARLAVIWAMEVA
jgi:hypothetical protein